MSATPQFPHTARPSVARLVMATLSLIVMMLIVVAGVALAAKFLRGHHAPVQRVVLPNGTRIEFLGTAASGATFSSDTPEVAWLRKILPARLTSWLLPRPFTGTAGVGTTNALIVYFRVKYSSASPSVPASPYAWNSFAAEDDEGLVYGPNGGGGSFGGAANENVIDCGLSAYPRRQKDFLFRFLSASGVTVATFRIPNPNPGPFPQWQPLPLPQSVTNGQVELTLKEFRRRQRGGYPPYQAPIWDFKSSQIGWSNAIVKYFTFLDSTGNDGRSLSPRESAWKVRASVMRTNPADFAPAEKLVISNLALPAPGNFLALNVSNLLLGTGIKVSYLCGPGCITISNGVPSMPRATQNWVGSSVSISSDGITNLSFGATNTFFIVEITNLQFGNELQFYLHDQDGRDIPIIYNGSFSGGGGQNYYMPQFTVPTGAKTLTLEAIVNHPLIFDFLVDPKDILGPVQTNSGR